MNKLKRRNVIQRLLRTADFKNLNFYEISRDVFILSLFVYFWLFLLEELKSGLISYYFNLNILALVVGISAIITIFSGPEIASAKQQLTWKDFSFILTLGFMAAVTIFLKIKRMGIISYFIALIAAIPIVVLSYLSYKKTKE